MQRWSNIVDLDGQGRCSSTASVGCCDCVQCDEDTADGVPPTAPVALLNVNPAGSAGEIDHDATGPPLDVGVTVLIGTPLTSVNELVL